MTLPLNFMPMDLLNAPVDRRVTITIRVGAEEQRVVQRAVLPAFLVAGVEQLQHQPVDVRHLVGTVRLCHRHLRRPDFEAVVRDGRRGAFVADDLLSFGAEVLFAFGHDASFFVEVVLLGWSPLS
jgi:hypothetical protein